MSMMDSIPDRHERIESKLDYLINLLENHILQRPDAHANMKKMLDATIAQVENSAAGKANPELGKMMRQILAPLTGDNP